MAKFLGVSESYIVKNKKNFLNRLSNSTATALLFSAGLISTSAFAQELDKEKSSEEETAPAPTLVIEEVFVTGSRIKRPGIDTVRPSVGISAELIEKRAFTNIADTLSEVPLFSGGLNPNGDQEELMLDKTLSTYLA